jgi:hypothetical protein
MLPALPTPALVLSSAAATVRRARRRALLGFSAVVALLHLALLGALDVGLGGARPPAGAAPPLLVRTIPAHEDVARATATPVVEDPVESAATSPAGHAAVPARIARIDRKASTRSPPRPVDATAAEKAAAVSAPVADGLDATPATVAGTSGEPSRVVDALVEMPSPAVDALVEMPSPAVDALVEMPSTSAASGDGPTSPGLLKVTLDTAKAPPGPLLGPGERPPPTYRTVLPGPALLRYELRRGLLRGTGEIRWRPAGDRYGLQFEARLAGLTLLAQHSQGELGPNGLAPVRFVDQRMRKAARSVNFSREAGSISFSASTVQWPLLPGTQDRLSWMIQLGGIVAADPSLAAGRISMVLVSARGQVSVRTARFAGRESAETASGSVPALKFIVDGHSAYDGSFEIWLDPGRGYLPARAVSRGSSGDAEFELLLQRADP